MRKFEKENIIEKRYKRDWKEKNLEYLYELEKFFDITDNVQDEKLKLDIIYQMLRCDELLTKIAEKNWENHV